MSTTRRAAFLDRLRTVDWSGHTVVEGAVDAVADDLARLAEPTDAAGALEAAGRLHWLLCYEDELVSDAALPALPFLIGAVGFSATPVRERILATVHRIVCLAAGTGDPWHHLRALPGADLLLHRCSPHKALGAFARSICGLANDRLDLLLDAMDALDQVGLAAGLARVVGRHTPFRETASSALTTRWQRDAATPRGLPWLCALSQLGQLEPVAPPDLPYARWIWATGTAARRAALDAVLLETPVEVIAEFDALSHGIPFFLGLGTARLADRPELQLQVAARRVDQIRARARPGPDGEPLRGGPDVGSLLLAFPNAEFPTTPAHWPEDLVELAFRSTFSARYNVAGDLVRALRKLGLPAFGPDAALWLEARGRSRLVLS